MEKASASVRLKQGRTRLLLDHPFFGTLLFRLKDLECRSIETMATDGVSLFFNPKFVDTLSSEELLGVLAHEVMHPALAHHTRRAKRDPKLWNIACDHAINPMIIDAGLHLPKGALHDYRFRNLSAERIYNALCSEENDKQSQQQGSQQEQQTGSGDSSSANGPSSPGKPNSGSAPGDQSSAQQQNGTSDGTQASEPVAPVTDGGFGQVLDAPNTDDQGVAATSDQVAQQEADWTAAVMKADAISKMAGKLPEGAKRVFDAAKSAQVDWREVLRQAFSGTIPTDYTWMNPDRRLVDLGIYLPGIECSGVGEIAIAVDCSGSVNSRQLGLFAEEMGSIIREHNPERVHVLYFDAKVQRVDVYSQGEPIALNPVGGGGTDFCSIFEYVEQNGIQPHTLVCFTDMWGKFPANEPPYPVIWAATDHRPAPFGEVVPLAAA